MNIKIGSPDNGPDLMINCLYVIALENFKIISRKIGKTFAFQKIIDELKVNIKRNFFDAKNGLKISKISFPGHELVVDHTWGYPGIYSFDGDAMKTNVYLVEKTFHKMEFNNAMQYFNGDIELKPAIDEILGDG